MQTELQPGTTGNVSQTPLTLYYSPGTASVLPHIVIEELQLPYDLKLVDHREGQHLRPEYLAINPNGLLPTLQYGDTTIYETAAICLHLIDCNPAPILSPAVGTPERAEFYKWLMWLTNTLQATIKNYWYPQRWATDDAGTATIKSLAEDKIGTMLDQLETRLEGRDAPWFLSDYSIIDPYIMMLGRWTAKFERPASARPALAALMGRVLDRPAVQQVFELHGIPKPWL